jgi:polar amino acid transport system substrate-binding protein
MKKFKKAIIVMMSVIFASALFAGCGKTSANQSQAQGTNSLDKVKKAGVLKIGLEDSFPPMEFRDKQNELKGFDIDMANAIGKN